MTLRVIIADDEPLAREQLRHLLSAEPGVTVTKECGNGPETVAAVRADRPDLLLLDVQMPDLDGFGVLCELRTDETPAVIFVTAYDQYALKAFEVRALDYLLKPVDPRRLKEALQRVRARISDPGPRPPDPALADLLREAEERRRVLQRLPVPEGDRILFLPVDSIVCLEASGNYVRVHVPGASYIRRETLAGIAQKLDPSKFARVHRSFIVNLDRVRELIPWFHRTYILVLETGQRVRVSRSFREPVEALLGRDPKRASR
jgi:two-component system LytT family response regulator